MSMETSQTKMQKEREEKKEECKTKTKNHYNRIFKDYGLILKGVAYA